MSKWFESTSVKIAALVAIIAHASVAAISTLGLA
jgi:hypothetical protein